jgi:hypothetical protein
MKTVFPIVERYREQLRHIQFNLLNDVELAEFEHRLAIARHSKAILGMALIPEQEEFFAMLVEERVGKPASDMLFRRFIVELKVVPSL